MAVSAKRLRANIYRILDQALETGLPVGIDRRSHRLRIVLAKEWLLAIRARDSYGGR